MTTAAEQRGPQRQDEPDHRDHPAPAGIGRTELGTIRIDDRVVTKLAARVAADVPDAGGPGGRLLGHSVPGAGALGLRSGNLDALPAVDADVDGGIALLSVSMSIRWPASVAAVTDQVRSAIRARLGAWTGLRVADIDVTVTGLVTDIPPPPRVR